MNELEKIVINHLGGLLLSNAKLSAELSDANKTIDGLKKEIDSLKTPQASTEQ